MIPDEDEKKGKQDEGKKDRSPQSSSTKREEEKEEIEALVFPDGTSVAAPGLGIHQILDGTRRWVPDTWTQAWLGIRMDEVVILFPDQLLAIPAGPPIQSRAPEEPLF